MTTSVGTASNNVRRDFSGRFGKSSKTNRSFIRVSASRGCTARMVSINSSDWLLSRRFTISARIACVPDFAGLSEVPR